MRGALALLVLAALAGPLAAAEALVAAPEDLATVAFYGLARDGRADASADWPVFGSPACAQVASRVWVRLEVLAGDPSDALHLDVPGAGWAVARPGAPVELEGVQGDPCPDFTVLGAHVAGAAPYRVSTRGRTL